MSEYDMMMAGDNGILAFIVVVLAVATGEIFRNRKYYLKKIKMNTNCLVVALKKMKMQSLHFQEKPKKKPVVKLKLNIFWEM